MTNRHALVVDDSRSARHAMRKYLERCRYDVTTAEDGREALGYLRQNRPLVVFLDYMMPGVNGLEVLRSMKNDPAMVDIPVVICTSVDRAEFKVEARGNGALEVLPKPPSPDVLQRLLAGIERGSAGAPAAAANAASFDAAPPASAPAAIGEPHAAVTRAELDALRQRVEALEQLRHSERAELLQAARQAVRDALLQAARGIEA